MMSSQATSARAGQTSFCLSSAHPKADHFNPLMQPLIQEYGPNTFLRLPPSPVLAMESPSDEGSAFASIYLTVVLASYSCWIRGHLLQA